MSKKKKLEFFLKMMKLDLNMLLQDYSDGNKEAVMTYYKYKDGKVVYMETGATKLPK